MSLFSTMLKRREKKGEEEDEVPVVIENGTVAIEDGAQEGGAPSKLATLSPVPNPSAIAPTNRRGSAVAGVLVGALRKLSTGNPNPAVEANQSQGLEGTDVAKMPEEAPMVNVVVVGAGLAGLSAAHSLRTANQGISVMILEASDRVGGRISTRDLESSAGRDFWDLGAHWISGSQIHMMQLIDQLDLQMYTQVDTGLHLAHFDDGRKVQFEAQFHPLSSMAKLDYNTFISKVEKLRLEVSLETPDECPMASDWDAMTLEQFRKQHIWTAAAQQYFDAQIKLLFGVRPCEMSTLFFLFALNSAGGWHSLFQMGSETAREFKIKGGTQRVCEILADKIDRSFLNLRDPVVSIDQGDSEFVSVRTLSGKRFRSDRVIVALPPKFAAKINFSPPMPRERDNLMQRMPAGNRLCFVVTYKEAFWQKLGFSGYVIRMKTPPSTGNKQQDDGPNESGQQIPFSALFDASTMDQSPALTGTVDETTKWKEIPAEERKAAILKGIEVYFGVEALEPLDYSELDWGAEPYCSSYPSCVLSPGAITGYFKELKKPFQRVHWAGAETTVRWFGLMEGAVHSGKRAAEEVLSELRPDAVINV